VLTQVAIKSREVTEDLVRDLHKQVAMITADRDSARVQLSGRWPSGPSAFGLAVADDVGRHTVW